MVIANNKDETEALPGRRKVFGVRFPVVCLLAALGCTALENVSAFDRMLQQLFFQNGEWLLSKSFHSEYKWLLYAGPKIFIGTIAGSFLILFLASMVSSKFKELLPLWRKPALLVLLSIIFVPLAVALLKSVTGVYSPVDMLQYGGKHPHIGLLEQLWTYGKTAGGRSFPAGHASGGFALVALYYLPVRSGYKKILFSAGLLTGWGMGLYQMARGEHFFSHTLTTMFLALAIMTSLDRIIHTSNDL
jgi:membrane-associated PAP2 superfamily phosphatase